MELKEQIKGELLKQKEEKRKLAIEANSKLKEVTLYTKEKNQLCENYKKFFTENGIKFVEKDITKYNEVISIVQMPSLPIIEVNDTYLVHGRDCQTPTHCLNALKHFASPDYVIPDPTKKMIESIKNLQFNIGKQMQSLNKQLMPVIKVMNELAAEEKAEAQPPKKEKSAKKNK